MAPYPTKIHSSTSTINFPEVLRSLISNKHVTQKDLAAAIKTSEASISNYINGKEQPTLKRLVLIANYFGVSLDYLIYGESTFNRSSVGFELYHAASDISHRLDAKLGRQTRLISRISTVIYTEMKRLVDETNERFREPSDNLLLEEEYWQLECCSSQVKCHNPTLSDDFTVDPITGDLKAGPFMHYVLENLEKEQNYEIYYLYSTTAMGGNRTDELKSIVTNLNAEVQDRVHIRGTDEPMQGYYGFQKVNMTRLQSRHPILSASIEEWIDNGWIGAVFSPTNEPNVNLLMDKHYLSLAIKAFDHMWSTGK